METELKILQIEDDEADSVMLRALLARDGITARYERVTTMAAFQEALERGRYDLILSDFTIPGMETLEALQWARERQPEVPFIFVSGTIGEDQAIETLKLGASDYVLKQRLARLAPAVRRALKEAKEHARRKQAEAELRKARDELARANVELERKVQERTAQLLEANASLQTFANTAAHDLRSPLRTIRSFTSLALEEFGPRLDPECRSYIERVAQSAEAMERLMADLLDYSRVEQAELTAEVVSLQKAAEEALALLQADIRAKNAAVTIQGPLPSVIGHEATVVLIINNFVSNALKFVARGVQPRVRIWAESRRDAETRGGGDAEMVRLWVEDDGIGINAADVPKLFGVFQRLHGKGVYPGTGLGLAIVRRGAERMGGQVGVESQPGRGSRFWVELRGAECGAQ